MAAALEKITAHYLALLTARRSRAILVPIAAIAVIFTLINITDRAYQQPSINVEALSSTNIERASTTEGLTDWSKFAYVRYATSSKYLCNAVMLLQSLHHLKSRADRVLMYPAKMLPDPEDVDGGGFQERELLVKARDEYGVKLVPVQVQHRDIVDDTWADFDTKLLAFNQTQYERPCRGAYWLLGNETAKEALASPFFVIQPYKYEFDRIQKAIAVDDEYDMELLNKLYHDTAMMLPHRPYTMMSSELRETNHTLYLGSGAEEWNSTEVMSHVRTIRISDYPVPKPWKKYWTIDDYQNFIKLEPRCEMKRDMQKNKMGGHDKEDGCSGRDAWRELYADFKARKATVCARKAWAEDDEVELDLVREEGMIGLNPIPYVEQDDTLSVLMPMDRNDYSRQK